VSRQYTYLNSAVIRKVTVRMNFLKELQELQELQELFVCRGTTNRHCTSIRKRLQTPNLARQRGIRRDRKCIRSQVTLLHNNLKELIKTVINN
jgi:hypothetical protein